MIADADRLNSKLRGAVVVDLEAARRARDMSGSSTSQPMRPSASMSIINVIIGILVVMFIIGSIRRG